MVISRWWPHAGRTVFVLAANWRVPWSSTRLKLAH